MGWSIKYPLGRDNAVSNLAGNVTREISGVGKDIGREINNAKDWANRGEIGKYTSGLADSFYNLYMAAPRAVVTGQYGKELKRAGGATLNLMTVGAASYGGKSSGVQKTLENKYVDKWTGGMSGDMAGTYRGINTLSSDGKISSEDRDDMLRFYGKSAAIGGGIGAYEYLSAPAAAGYNGQATGAVLIESGTPVVTESVVSSSAAGSSSFWGTLASGTAKTAEYGLIAKVLTGQQTLGEAANTILNPGTAPSNDWLGGIWDTLGGLFGGGPQPVVMHGPGASVSAPPPLISENSGKLLAIGAAAGIGYLIYKKVA